MDKQDEGDAVEQDFEETSHQPSAFEGKSDAQSKLCFSLCLGSAFMNVFADFTEFFEPLIKEDIVEMPQLLPQSAQSLVEGSLPSVVYCDLQGRKINITNCKTLVGRCRDRP